MQQELKEKFAKLVSNPDMWLLEARTLFISASLVAEEVRRRWDDRDPRNPKIGNQFPTNRSAERRTHAK